jgi:hypothetical protein
MSDLLVYVIIAIAAIAGAAAWLYFPKREPQVRDGPRSRNRRPHRARWGSFHEHLKDRPRSVMLERSATCLGFSLTSLTS